MNISIKEPGTMFVNELSIAMFSVLLVVVIVFIYFKTKSESIEDVEGKF